MRVFLSYKFGDDIAGIRNLLKKLEIETWEDIQIGDSLQQAVKAAVKGCDFVVFVYSEDNPNIAFEAGLAVAFGKPIFSILSGSDENTFLLDSTYVHARPDEIEKIQFSLELFIKNLLSKKVTRRAAVRTQKFYGGGEAVPNKSYFDIAQQYEAVANGTGEELENFIEKVLSAYAIRTAKGPDTDDAEVDWYPDFSIWSDELSQILGNPIIIEVKKEINSKNLPKLVSQVRSLKSSNPSNSVIIFYNKLKGIEEKDLPANPHQLYIAIPQLVNTLDSGGFASAIKTFRNSIVHSS